MIGMFSFDIEEKRILKTTAYYCGAHFANFPLFFNSMNHFDNSQILYVTEVERLVELSSDVKKSTNVDLVCFKDSGYKMAFSYRPFYYATRSDDQYAVNRIKIGGKMELKEFKKIVNGKDKEYINPDA